MIIKKITGLFFLWICLFCWNGCSGPQLAGGSEVGNPAVVAGIVQDSSGKGIADVTLYLTDPLETNPARLSPDSVDRAVSGPEGRYWFSGVKRGTYNLMGTDKGGEKMFLTVIELKPDANEDTLQRGTPDTLQCPAKILVSVTECSEADEDFIFIPGTVVRSYIDSCGEYLLSCPASVIDIMRFTDDSMTILETNIVLSARQWVDLTHKNIDIPTPEIISGVITGGAGSVYWFIAGDIHLGSDQTVHYRFDWGDSVSSWNLSSRQSHVWNTPGSYRVRTQARSAADTLSVSPWSESVTVTIR